MGLDPAVIVMTALLWDVVRGQSVSALLTQTFNLGQIYALTELEERHLHSAQDLPLFTSATIGSDLMSSEPASSMTDFRMSLHFS